MVVDILLTILVLKLWKECLFLFLFLSLAIFGVHPIAALGIGFVSYLIAFIWEKFNGSQGSGTESET